MRFLAASPPLALALAGMKMRPLGEEHAALDYEAVTASAAALRRATSGAWPPSDLTFEANLADVRAHAADFVSGVSLTYTILSDDERSCLGCVYVSPLEALRARAKAVNGALDAGPHDAEAWFWTRAAPPAVMQARADQLIAHLEPWLLGSGAVERVVHVAPAIDADRVARLEHAGLRRTVTVTVDEARLILMERPGGASSGPPRSSRGAITVASKGAHHAD